MIQQYFVLTWGTNLPFYLCLFSISALRFHPSCRSLRLVSQTIAFLRKKEGFIVLVLKHMEASAIMDLLLRLMSCVEPVQLRHDVLTVSRTVLMPGIGAEACVT